MRLTEADNGRSIELHVGDKLTITLSGSVTTGYQWDVGSVTTGILRLRSEPEAQPLNEAVGGESKIILRFEAIAKGQTALNLIYHRPFEKDVPPIKTFDVMVTVK